LSSVPISCPSGFYCPGQTGSPISCDAGYHCAPGSFNKMDCPKNSFSLPESGQCSPCLNGEFTEGPRSSKCLTCPSDKFDLSGWYCMTNIQKGLFLLGWIITILSAILSVWRGTAFVKKRYNHLKKLGAPFTLKNFIFLPIRNESLSMIELVENSHLEKIKALEESVRLLREDLEKN